MKQKSVSDKYRVKILGKLSKCGIAQHIDDAGILYGTNNRTIYTYHKNRTTKIGKFPISYPRDIFSWSRILSRAARTDKSNIYVNAVGKIIGIRGGVVYSVAEGGKCHPLFNIQGDCVLHRGICEDYEGWTYFGEYFTNRERKEVYIYRISPDLQKWEIAYKFSAGKIRHVHAVIRDPFDGKSLWVTVGDYQNECFIIKTNDRFETTVVYGNGDQVWRAVTLFFTESHVCWITDSHLEQNYACRMDRTTGEIEKGQKIYCPSWYGCTTKQGVHVAFTTVETGPGVKKNQASIFLSDDAYNWDEVYSFEKDGFRPYKIFKNGVICCPSGSSDLRNFFIFGEGLVGLDGLTYNLNINKFRDP